MANTNTNTNLLAQIALARDAPEAVRLVAECERIILDEAEPRQHRHLTNAWLAQKQSRWADAATEMDRARAAFGDKARCGDHTPHLLTRSVISVTSRMGSTSTDPKFFGEHPASAL